MGFASPYAIRKNTIIRSKDDGSARYPKGHAIPDGMPYIESSVTADNRVVEGSNPTGAAWKLWQFLLPHFASVFRKKH